MSHRKLCRPGLCQTERRNFAEEDQERDPDEVLNNPQKRDRIARGHARPCVADRGTADKHSADHEMGAIDCANQGRETIPLVGRDSKHCYSGVPIPSRCAGRWVLHFQELFQGVHQGALGLSKKEKFERADELKPLGRMSLPHFSPKPLSLFSTESEDSAALLTQCYSSFLQLLSRAHENTFIFSVWCCSESEDSAI